jgi:hypothetical protein
MTHDTATLPFPETGSTWDLRLERLTFGTGAKLFAGRKSPDDIPRGSRL